MFASYVWAHGKPQECDACELVFGELLGNVTKHAPGPVEILLRWEQGAGVLEIGDFGSGYGGADLHTYQSDGGRNVTHVVLPVRKAE